MNWSGLFAHRSPSSLVLLLWKSVELAYPELKAYMHPSTEALGLKPTSMFLTH